MMKHLISPVARFALIGAALALAGCAANTPEARVTRFHLGQPIAPGDIAVEPRDPGLAGDLEFRSYADSVAQELARLGFRIAPGVAKSELVAVVEVDRNARPLGPARSPFTIGLGGGSFGGGVGLGGSVQVPIGKAKQNYATTTELAVQIKRRSDGTVIWEGRAQAQAKDGTPYASPATAVRNLSAALFRDFPGESGRTITVK